MPSHRGNLKCKHRRWGPWELVVVMTAAGKRLGNVRKCKKCGWTEVMVGENPDAV